ncbi:hypothetical protein ACLOJK_013513 [Asimina triloba]
MVVELSTARHDKTYKDRKLEHICVNEFMIKAKGIPMEWREKLVDILEASSQQKGQETAFKEALEELRKTFNEEEKIRKAEELQLRAVVALSREKALQVVMEVSTVKGPKAVVVESDDNKMLEVEDTLLLGAVIPEAASLLRLKATPETLKPLLEGRGPTELKLLEHLPNIWRELKDLEERISSIDGFSAWPEYQY